MCETDKALVFVTGCKRYPQLQLSLLRVGLSALWATFKLSVKLKHCLSEEVVTGPLAHNPVHNESSWRSEVNHYLSISPEYHRVQEIRKYPSVQSVVGKLPRHGSSAIFGRGPGSTYFCPLSSQESSITAAKPACRFNCPKSLTSSITESRLVLQNCKQPPSLVIYIEDFRTC
jgi:hypothetical protein